MNPHPSEVTAREPQLTKELIELERVTTQMSELINNLEARLGPVLHNEPPALADTTAKEPDSLVPHASSIRDSRLILASSYAQLLSIQERLEV